MNQEYTAALLDLVDSQQPKSCLVLSDAALELLTEVGAKCEFISLDKTLFDAAHYHSEKLSAALSAINPDLVIVGDVLSHLSETAAIEIVAMLRNQLNAQIILLQNPNTALQFHDLLGLGFKREFKRSEQDELSSVDRSSIDLSARDLTDCEIYSYDISNYNKKRDWNNSRFWANPQNFEKYRW
jgi:hypothetical protein